MEEKLVTIRVREQRHYKKTELSKMLTIPGKTVSFREMIKQLTSLNIIKRVKTDEVEKDFSEYLDSDEVVSDITDVEEPECEYAFKYVGLISMNGLAIKSYPKCFRWIDSAKSTDKAADDLFRKIVLVIRKYQTDAESRKKNKSGYNIIWGQNNTSKSVNMLALIISIIEDYSNFGLYYINQRKNEINGNGEIDWARTIELVDPVIEFDRPYYTDCWTTSNTKDTSVIVRLIQSVIVSEASRLLVQTGLTDILGIDPVFLTDSSLESIGDKEFLLAQIEREKSRQFHTRELRLLDLLYAFISERSRFIDYHNNLNLLGTNSFEMVWQEICSKVFCNVLNTSLAEVFGETLNSKYDVIKLHPLKDIMEYPYYINSKFNGKNELYLHTPSTFILDLVSIDIENSLFAILDAKYFIPSIFNGKLNGAPGVNDISKQYLYQKAYNQLLKDQNIKYFRNCFLMPTEGNDIVDAGIAYMDMISDFGLKPIQIRLLPAEKMFDNYLDNGMSPRISLNDLNLLSYRESFKTLSDSTAEYKNVILNIDKDNINLHGINRLLAYLYKIRNCTSDEERRVKAKYISSDAGVDEYNTTEIYIDIDKNEIKEDKYPTLLKTILGIADNKNNSREK